MTISMHQVSVAPFKAGLKSLDAILDKAKAWTETKKIDPNALPLSLESGSLQSEVVATVGAIGLSTVNASTLAQDGTTYQAGHDPDTGLSRFICLAGTLQVQPTATGAPLLTLGPGQFVDVTVAGAGPVGQLRYVYLPQIQR